jgi:N-acetylglutamate synthase-like GNAT family acetyltransferase
VSFSAWLKRAFRGRGRFDPTVGAQHIPSATVRRFSELDTAACRELYELNEPGRFPSGYLEEFLSTLKSSLHLYLVIEAHGKVAAVGGIYRTPEAASGCSLVFGMVHPSHHKQGLGTALLLARLAALGRPPHIWWAFLASAGGSSTFFERFGFQHYGRYPHPPDMRIFDCYRSYLEESDWESCANILAQRGVHFDRSGIDVPLGPAIPNKSLERTREQ